MEGAGFADLSQLFEVFATLVNGVGGPGTGFVLLLRCAPLPGQHDRGQLFPVPWPASILSLEYAARCVEHPHVLTHSPHICGF